MYACFYDFFMETLKDFQLPAAFGRSRLDEDARVYRSFELVEERVSNAGALYDIIEGLKNAEVVYDIIEGLIKPEVDWSFETCFDHLVALAKATKVGDFYTKYELFAMQQDFLKSLAKRLMHQKIRYACGGQDASVWTIVGCGEITQGTGDPAVDIVEDETGKDYCLFLTDAMARLITGRR